MGGKGKGGRAILQAYLLDKNRSRLLTAVHRCCSIDAARARDWTITAQLYTMASPLRLVSHRARSARLRFRYLIFYCSFVRDAPRGFTKVERPPFAVRPTFRRVSQCRACTVSIFDAASISAFRYSDAFSGNIFLYDGDRKLRR